MKPENSFHDCITGVVLKKYPTWPEFDNLSTILRIFIIIKKKKKPKMYQYLYKYKYIHFPIPYKIKYKYIKHIQDLYCMYLY